MLQSGNFKCLAPPTFPAPPPPHAKQTPSEHLGKTFEIQTALKYFSPLFFSICLTKATTTTNPKRTFYRCVMTRQAHQRTSRKRKQSKKDRQTDRRTCRQTGRRTDRETVMLALKPFAASPPPFWGFENVLRVDFTVYFRPCVGQLLCAPVAKTLLLHPQLLLAQ